MLSPQSLCPAPSDLITVRNPTPCAVRHQRKRWGRNAQRMQHSTMQGLVKAIPITTLCPYKLRSNRARAHHALDDQFVPPSHGCAGSGLAHLVVIIFALGSPCQRPASKS